MWPSILTIFEGKGSLNSRPLPVPHPGLQTIDQSRRPDILTYRIRVPTWRPHPVTDPGLQIVWHRNSGNAIRKGSLASRHSHLMSRAPTHTPQPCQGYAYLNDCNSQINNAACPD
jgi:hypothetical protein